MPQPLQEIQTRIRREQKTDQWQRSYVIRADYEATASETIHAPSLRRCRYRGIAKTHGQYVLTAAGADIIRLSDCFPPGTTPDRSPRPPSPFQRLCRELTG
ncbi:transposase [Streptomyces fulvoviolaceus]|nr:transposase [Streptomyces fulvoviolaceus]